MCLSAAAKRSAGGPGSPNRKPPPLCARPMKPCLKRPRGAIPPVSGGAGPTFDDGPYAAKEPSLDGSGLPQRRMRLGPSHKGKPRRSPGCARRSAGFACPKRGTTRERPESLRPSSRKSARSIFMKAVEQRASHPAHKTQKPCAFGLFQPAADAGRADRRHWFCRAGRGYRDRPGVYRHFPELDIGLIEKPGPNLGDLRR